MKTQSFSYMFEPDKSNFSYAAAGIAGLYGGLLAGSGYNIYKAVKTPLTEDEKASQEEFDRIATERRINKPFAGIQPNRVSDEELEVKYTRSFDTLNKKADQYQKRAGMINPLITAATGTGLGLLGMAAYRRKNPYKSAFDDYYPGGAWSARYGS